MMTQQLRFSVLTAPLAAIDRRSLSQAWYSALHIAGSERPRAGPVSAPAVEARVKPAGLRAHPEFHGTQLRTQPNGRSVEREEKTPMRREAADRRAARSPLARKIERSFLDPRYRVHRATFTLEGVRTRVHIALQTSGPCVRLIAVCPPAVRATVARALDEARYALAQRGITLRAETRDTSCS